MKYNLHDEIKQHATSAVTASKQIGYHTINGNHLLMRNLDLISNFEFYDDVLMHFCK